jgi:hypothetical protein
MANRFHRVPTNFHIPWRSAFLFFSFFRLQWSDQLPCKISDEQMKHASRRVLNLIWKMANPTTTSSWAKNSVTKWEVVEGFWKVAHENLLGMAWNTMHRNLWWTLWKWLAFWELDAREVFPLSIGFWLARLGSKHKSCMKQANIYVIENNHASFLESTNDFSLRILMLMSQSWRKAEMMYLLVLPSFLLKPQGIVATDQC